jgi:hypothetical protein
MIQSKRMKNFPRIALLYNYAYPLSIFTEKVYFTIKNYDICAAKNTIPSVSNMRIKRRNSIYSQLFYSF